MIFLEESQTATVLLGPFVDETTGKDAEEALTLTQADIHLSKNGAALAQKNDATSATHRGKGYYSVPLNGTDTGTLGHLYICVHESGALPVWLNCHVVAQNVYDSLFGSGDLLQVDTREFSLSTLALTTQMKADVNTEADSALTDYDPPTKGEMDTGFSGLNDPSAADVADAVWDEDIVAAHNTGDTAGALLDDLGTPANFMANVTNLDAAITTRATPAQVATECDAALSDIDLDHLIQVTAGAEEPTDGSYLDQIMHKDAGQTFDPTTDSLEALRENQSGATPAAIADAVWDEDIVAAHNTADTAGALLDDLGTPANFMANVTNLDAAVSTRATPAQVGTEVDGALADIDLDHLIQITAGAEEPTDGSYLDQIMHKDAGQTFDPTTDSLEALRENQSGATPAAIADAVWLETLADHSGSSGSTAEALAGASAPSAADVADAVWDEDIVAAHNTGDTAGALLDDLGTPADFKATVTNLDVAVSTRATPAQVATEVDGALADIDLDHLIQITAGAEEPTDGSYLDQIMHKDAGQTFDPTTDSLEALRENQSGATPAAIADAVWDEDIVAAHNTGDTAGALLDDLGTPADFKATVTNLDVLVSTRATPAQVNTEAAAALATYDPPTKGEMDTGFSALNDPDAAAIADAVWDEDIVAAHNTGDTAGALLDDLGTPANFMANVTNLDAAITTRATPAQVGTEVDGALADIDLDHLIQVTAGAEEPTDGSYLDQIMHKDVSQTFDPTTDSLEALRDNQGGATAAAIADAVWLETLADHSGSSGSTAEALAGASAPSAADVADAVWDEDIVAAHNTGDTAGALLDDLGTPADFKATVSALATSAEIAALNDPAAGAIADAVWDEDIVAAHNTGDTAGALLDDLGTPADFKADVSALATAAAVAALNDPTALAIADAVWDEATADHQSAGSTGKALAGAGAGAGAITFVYTLTSTGGGNPPIADADVWVTSDVDGDNTVASGRTDAQGKVTFYLDAATYYFWRQKTGWDFTNPDTEVVS